MAPHTQNAPAVKTAGSDISSIHARIKIFENPFAHQVNNTQVNNFCSHCMRLPSEGKLLTCGGCEFTRYCNKECQRLAWKVHRPECRRLKKAFPNLPLTEVLFLSKVIDRVVFLRENGDKFGWEKERKFSSLVDHKEDIKNDPVKMEHYEKIKGKMVAFRGDEMVDDETLWDTFCKTSINSHSIHTNVGNEVGCALDLGVSKYNHSCRPSCSMVFDGYRVCLRPLVPGVDAADFATATISYIDVGRSKHVRRKDLKTRWYFDCECVRCADAADDALTAIKCGNENCDQAIIISEVSEPCYIECAKCGFMLEDTAIEAAQNLMKSLPAQFDPQCPAQKLEALILDAEKLLHPQNVYLTRLRTAHFHITGKLAENIPLLHKHIYENYKLCFPKADRHVGYQLLHMVKALIENNERDKAVPYAYDAMNIFEVCFGLDHPYYLQTLALWTYLEQKSNKTAQELIQLTNFSDNRLVDIATLLQKAASILDAPEEQKAVAQ